MYHKVLALVAFVVLSGSLVSCGTVCPKPDVWLTVKDLNKYLEGTTDEYPLFDQLKRAYEQFIKCPSDYREELIKENPRIAFLNDFLFTPMKRFLKQEHLNDQEAENAFAIRLVKAYHRFRPIYMKDDAAATTYIRSPKTKILLQSLGQLKGHKSFSGKMLMEAKKEHDTYLAKVHEMVTYEDVYAEEDDLANLMKYFSKTTTKVLEEYIFPMVSQDMELTPQVVNEMRNLYNKGLIQRGYYIKNGVLYRNP